MNLNTINIIIVALITGLLSIGTMTGCKGGQEVTGGKSRITAETRTKANVQTFVTYKYIDKMTGMEAFHLLIPKGWRAEGTITWSANPALPAQARFRFSNPNGTEEF
ncbi:MAG: hypothetical protein AB1638_09440, partial [Nitrospirota bacterium]